MISLSDLPHELLRLVGLVMRQVAQLAATPWQLDDYCVSRDVPKIPTDLAHQIKLFSERDTPTEMEPEAAAEALRDALEIIDGLRDAYDTALRLGRPDLTDSERAEAVFECIYRFLYPIILVCARRDETVNYYYPAIALLGVIDDHLAENFPGGLIFERLAVALKSLWQEEEGGTADAQMLAAHLSVAAATLATTVLLQNLSKTREAKDWQFSYGWQSEIAVPEYGDPSLPPLAPGVPDRPTPVWMAQRAFSFRAERHAQPFTIVHYNEAARPGVTDDDRSGEVILGVTVVPVPRYIGGVVASDDDSSEPPLAGGPALYIQAGGEAADNQVNLGSGWKIRMRRHFEQGFQIAIPSSWSDVGLQGAAAGGGVEIELGWAPAVAPPTNLPPVGDAGGAQGGVSADLGGFAAIAFAGGGFGGSTSAAGSTFDDIGINLRVSKLRLVFAPKSALLKQLLKGSLTTSLDVGLTASLRRGLVIDGSSGLELYLPLRQSLGSRWLGGELSYLKVRLAAKRGDAGTELSLEGTLGVSFSFAGVTMILEGLGVRGALRSGERDGNLLRIANLDTDFVPPAGIGLKLSWGPVKGGGILSRDPALDRYAGAVEVALGKNWVLQGVAFCEPRQGGGTSTLISAALERSIPTPGFSISGVGFLLGLHRRADGEAMRDGLVSGALEAMLFPVDPIRNSTALVTALAAMFPPADNLHVVAVMLKLSFAGGLAFAKLGLLVQFGTGQENRTKIFLVASVVMAPPSPLDRVLRIQVLGVGEYDPVTGEIYIRARLLNSRLCGGDLLGEAILFSGDPDPNDADPSSGIFASIGGYHPRYFGSKGPGKARVDRRLTLTVAPSDKIKLDMQFYLALTPSAFHVGARAQLIVRAGGFGVEGQCGFDGLVTYDLDFVISVFGSVKLILFSRTVTELRLEGELSGQAPWRIAGKVAFSVAWWTVSKSFDEDLSSESGSAATREDVIALVRASLHDPSSYDSAGPAGVVLKSVQRTGIWAAPERALRLAQKVAPLDTAIERIGRTPFATPQTLHIDSVELAGALLSTNPTTAEFAPGVYFTLSGDAALVAPAAERLPAGFEAAGDAVAMSGEMPAGAQYDEIIIDRKHRAARPRRAVISTALLQGLMSPVVPPLSPIVVRPPRFLDGTQATSFSSAWAAKHGLVVRADAA